MENLDGTNRFLVSKRIEHIMTIAKEAVEFDEKKEYIKALTLYSVCTTLISSEINTWDSSCSDSVKNDLIRLKNIYSFRMDSIQSDQLRSYSSGCSIETPNVDYSRFNNTLRGELSFPEVNYYHQKDEITTRIKKLLDIVKNENRAVNNSVILPEAAFDIEGVAIPLFNEKMALCRVIGYVTCDWNEPSALYKSIETIFNALYQFKIQAREMIHYEYETEKILFYPNKKLASSLNSSSKHLSSAECVCVGNADLKEYKYLFKRSLETLVWLPAARIMAMEGRPRTPDELEEDKRIVKMINNCNIILNDVYIPLFMADLHHLMEVYIDYRKQKLLQLCRVC